jgi:translation initiation factor 1
MVRGLPLDEAAMVALGKRLRNACGAGGTQKDGVIEVQGDHVDRLVGLLQAEGWRVKRAGA